MNNYQFLPQIHSPADLNSISDRDIPVLAGEIRQEIIETLAENGGHLASNLGMVEATLALHRTFSCTGGERSDDIVFDVGHQCYTHKLLTGRFDRFRTVRQGGGLSGFTNRSESPYDAMTCGHSGSSVSAAMGIAEANRLNYGIGKDAPWTVAVVGDGSFTNGMIFEALNSLAGRQLNLIIVLNDNEMSISKNVGGLSKYLSYIR
ncbi:MAG: 1-deoxy-D-xylulose-5-phosphate synthase, partial [Clostridia bacterium]|nr:1-deoxy-D-xylulose-5-phosphate synthase [Clostridia bacterium]